MPLDAFLLMGEKIQGLWIIATYMDTADPPASEKQLHVLLVLLLFKTATSECFDLGGHFKSLEPWRGVGGWWGGKVIMMNMVAYLCTSAWHSVCSVELQEARGNRQLIGLQSGLETPVGGW